MCVCVCVCVCVFRLRVSDCESVSPALVNEMKNEFK